MDKFIYFFWILLFIHGWLIGEPLCFVGSGLFAIAFAIERLKKSGRENDNETDQH